MPLEVWLLIIVGVIAVFNLSVCIAARAWGVLIFASLMYGAMALLLLL